MNKIYIGIDVGKDGGFVTIDPNRCISTLATPTTGPAAKKEINKQGIKEFFQEQIKTALTKHNGAQVIVVIEDVHSIFGASAKSNFQFGRALGIVEGMIEALEIQYYKVAPKKWQEVCFQGVPIIKKPGAKVEGRGGIDTKAMALIAAQRLYPKLDLRKSQRAEKAHNGIVDALLMAHYCSLKY
jgi:hypothetical protein